MQNSPFLEKILSAAQKADTHYHSTFEFFDSFDFSKSPLGMHFGTKETAINRLGVKQAEDERLGKKVPHGGQNPHLIEVKLLFNNPLKLGENRSGQWNPIDVIRAAFEKAEEEGLDGITDEEIDLFYEDEIWLDGCNFHDISLGEPYKGIEFDYDEAEKAFVKDWLNSKGYDAVVYDNAFEVGGESIMIFNEKQINITQNVALNPDFKPTVKGKSLQI
ncbi:hypothetical protein VCHA53O466_50392 [Vibrio chagasii]|nr:hypothetical protein VCHA53O466_50392 [Vibrio chagasii]